ncbi:MAG: SbcC/MukB-like Walker B domain-containing protein, partial [Jatrophihabitantaceae bacterium]
SRRAEREAAGRGFADLSAAAVAVRSEADQLGLQRAVDQWQADGERLRSAAAADEFTEVGPSGIEAAQRRVTTAQLTLAGTERSAQDAADHAELARHRVERLGTRRAEVARAAQALFTLEEQAAPVVYLAKLTRGMTGQRRVALTTYVLRHWFEQVVQAANLRLASMSSGRYELLRVDGVPAGGSKAERTGLTLQVVDRHTGEQRSPRSLSGGETFYTSLALALGLADVVRAQAGGVELDTLFIDEGFGSLDPDTLEEVMSVIDDLRDRGRVVGIVSHVADLKDRIAEHIEVRRIADGSSVLRVVA